MNKFEAAFEARKELLFFYSPYNFIREANAEKQTRHFVSDRVAEFSSKANHFSYQVTVAGEDFFFLYSILPWDSAYFNLPTYKLFSVLFTSSSLGLLTKAAENFKAYLFQDEMRYCFIDIPSEDIQLIQAMGNAGFRLVETRLNLLQGNIQSFVSQRHKVRQAQPDDIENLKRVAREMRNQYDRFHADPVFNPQTADEFLATYIEQAVKGFCDIVLVPAEEGIASDAFVAGNYYREDWEITGVKACKMVVSAVSSKTNKGWYRKIISEMAWHFKAIGADYIFMNTQSTNRAVLHTLQDLGFRVVSSSHILSFNN